MMNNIIHQYLRGYDMAKSKRGLFHGKTKLHGHRISFSHRVYVFIFPNFNITILN